MSSAVRQLTMAPGRSTGWRQSPPVGCPRMRRESCSRRARRGLSGPGEERPGVPLAVMSGKSADESRAGVPLTNLDQQLFDGADATKRDLVEYLDAVHEAIISALEESTAFGDSRSPWARSVHAEERPQVHAVIRAHG